MCIKAVFLLGIFILVRAQNDDYIRACYYTNWSQYRPEPNTFFPPDIDPSLCDHIFFAFAILDENNHISTFEYNDEMLYSQLQALKGHNPQLKTLLGVGGWNFAMGQVTIMLETPESRAEFINSAIPFVRLHGFDGIDLDFEYPGAIERGGRPEDKERFTALVQEMKSAIVTEASSSGQTQLLLTAAVGAGKETIDNAYEIEIIAQELDYINLMAYDLNGAWENYTGINAPLYPRAGEDEEQILLNVEFAVDYWLSLGAIKERLLIGIAFYGRCFTLTTEETGLGAPAYGPGPAGPFTREAGFYAAYEICSQPGTKVFNEEHMAPYAFTDEVWVGYDDHRSIACKLAYMMDKDLGGFFVWAIDLDDFTGEFCGEGTYPLFKQMLEVLDGDAHGVCGRRNSTVTTTTPGPATTTADPFCLDKTDGLYEHEICTKYIHCVSGVTNVYDCPACLIAWFTDDAFICDYPCDDDKCYDEPCEVICE